MSWWVHARVDGEVVRLALDEAAAELGPPAGPGSEALLGEVEGDDLGTADELVLSVAGDGPSYDLRVRDRAGGAELRVTGMDLTMRSFCHLPDLDAVVLIEGDRATDVSRNLLLVPLAPLREALVAGKGEVEASRLDYGRVRAAPNRIDLEEGTLHMRPLPSTTEMVAFRNVPRANPTQSELHVVDFPYYTAGEPAEGVTSQVSRPLELSGLWTYEVMGGRAADGRLCAFAVGVGRRRQAFYLAVHTLWADRAGSSLRLATTTEAFEEHLLDGVELRHNASVLALAPLPEARGFLAALEDPMRREHLYRVDVDPEGVRATEIEVDSVPSALRITAEDPGAEAEEVSTSELPAEGGDSGVVTVSPEGLGLAIGRFDAQATPEVRAYVLGDGAGAVLTWWLSHDEGDGAVDYVLHLRAAREVRVRYRVVREPGA